MKKRKDRKATSRPLLGRSRKDPTTLQITSGPGDERELHTPAGPLALKWRSRFSSSDGSADSDGDRPHRPLHLTNKVGQWRRPTGKNLNEYSNWEKWQTEMWMWEFLRRDKRYQEYANDETSDMTTAAAEHFLQTYKPHAEEYEPNPPRFLVSITSYPKREQFSEVHLLRAKGQEIQDDRRLSIKLGHDDVAITFKIAPMLFNLESSLAKQLKDAEDRLRDFGRLLRGIYLEDTSRNKTTNPRPYSPEELLKMIRCLDLKVSTSLNGGQIFDVLNPQHPDTPSEDSNVDPDKRASDIYREALDLAGGGYTGLVLSQVKSKAVPRKSVSKRK